MGVLTALLDGKALLVGAALLAVLGLGYGQLKGCQADKVKAELADTKEELLAAKASFAALEAARQIDNIVLAGTQRQQIETAVKAKGLEAKLREAMRREKNINFDSVLARDVSDAFCLRWLEAAGYAAAGTDSAGNADEGKTDTAAALCRGWENLTVRDVFEWAGLLLDHAGAERLDKAGMREWAKSFEVQK